MIKFRPFKTLNVTKFLQDLEAVPWSVVDSFDNINDAISVWYTLFYEVVDLHLPLIEKRVKNKKQPDFLTEELIEAIAKRDKFKSICDFENYRIWRNRSVYLNRKAKQDFYKNSITAGKGDPKRLWKYLRDLLPCKQKNTSPSLLENNVPESDPLKVANIFNQYFTTVSDQYVPSVAGPCYNNIELENFINSKLDPEISFSIPEMTVSFVQKQLEGLKINKATGLDGISPRLLKISAPIISVPLTALFNKCITVGTFPTKWKTTKVCPVHKHESLYDKSNYRPISIVDAVTKIIERHIFDHFYKFLTTHSLLHTTQSGFRHLHSCETALAQLMDNWTGNMEKGELNGVVLLDLRKAFDLVNHSILLEKLRLYRCNDLTIKWFTSYLSERSQCVYFKGSQSEKLSVKKGVPQGSILGPLLFIVFINDLPLITSKSDTDMFADDSILYSSGTTLTEIETNLNTDLDKVENWCIDNNMAINIGKTKTMLITTAQKAATMDRTDLMIKLNDVPLVTTTSEKLFGVYVDNRLSWKTHVHKMAIKISRSIALLRRIKQFLPLEARKAFYYANIQSQLDYCSVVWGPSANVDKLFKLQKRAVRLILDKQYRAPTKELFISLNIMPITDRINFRIVTYVYKALHNCMPQYISNMFSYVNNNRLTRSSVRRDLALPNRRLKISRKHLRYEGAKLYNSISTDIRNSDTFKTFKTSYMKNYYSSF